MRGVSLHCFPRNVVRENFIVRVKDHAALAVNDLLVNVFLRSEPCVFVMLDCLQINQAKRKDAEQRNECSTDQSATNSATWIHVAPEDWPPVEPPLRRLIALESSVARYWSPKPESFSGSLLSIGVATRSAKSAPRFALRRYRSECAATRARSPLPFCARQDGTVAVSNKRKPVPRAPEMQSSQSSAPARPR